MSLAAAIVLESIGLLFVISFILCGVVVYEENYHLRDDRIGIGCKLFLSISIILATIGFAIGATFTAKAYNKSYETVEYEIYSLDRGAEVSGSFALGSGSIDTYIAYYFYVETDKGFELKRITNSSTSIYLVETNERTPCVVTIKEPKSFGTYKVIYVPVGTVVKSFVG